MAILYGKLNFFLYGRAPAGASGAQPLKQGFAGQPEVVKIISILVVIGGINAFLFVD